MHHQINRKIFIYLIIFLFLGTFTNKKFLNFTSLKIDNYEIIGLKDLKNDQIYDDLSYLKNENLFFLEKEKIIKIIETQKIVEKFSVFKKYPSNLQIKVEKTNFLALTKKNGQDFYIGSNGNLIKVSDYIFNLPFVFGNIEIKEFLKLKKIIDNSNFNYKNIKNLYYFKSRRWDIETKNGLIIKLPIKRLENSFEKLLKLYEKEEFKNSTIIDLRQSNQIILNG